MSCTTLGVWIVSRPALRDGFLCADHHTFCRSQPICGILRLANRLRPLTRHPRSPITARGPTPSRFHVFSRHNNGLARAANGAGRTAATAHCCGRIW